VSGIGESSGEAPMAGSAIAANIKLAKTRVDVRTI
jgi:hypothetical protein